MTDQAPQAKKEPYTGDPNARLTVCPKKLRRHLGSDLMYLPVSIPVEGGEGEESTTQVQVAVICKHCNGDPVLYKDEPLAEKDAA